MSHQAKQKYSRHAIAVFLLVMMVVASLVRSLNYPFQFDSLAYYTDSNLGGLLQGFSLKGFLLQQRTVVQLLSALQYRLCGLEPFSFRLVNVVFHAANTALIYFLIHRFFVLAYARDHNAAGHGRLWAFVGALFFGLNPAGIYAVVYVVQRFVLMATFFSLAGVLSLLHGLVILDGAQAGQKKWRGVFLIYLSVLFYFLAVHSKEHAVMLPGVLVCLVFVFRTNMRPHLKHFFVPFFLCVLIGGHIILAMKGFLFRVYEPHASLAVQNLQNTLAEKGVETDLGTKRIYFLSVFNQCGLFFRYLYLWIIPDFTRMALEINLKFPHRFLSWQVVAGGLCFVSYVSVALSLLLKSTAKKMVGLGLIYPAILFMTEFSTVRFHEGFVIYRSYLWVSGLSIAVAFVLRHITETITGRLSRLGAYAVLLIYFAMMLVATQDRISPFASDLALWRDISKRIDFNDKTIPNSFRAAGNLGSALGKAGQYDEAIRYYEIAARLNPGYILPWHTLGAVIAIDGNKGEAVRFLERAVKINPGNPEPYYNLGSIYSGFGDYEKAALYFKKSLALDPRFKESLYNLANAFFKMGKISEALVYYRKALQVFPEYLDARHNLAVALTETGSHAEAIREYMIVVSKKPDYAQAYYNMGRSFMALNQFDAALKNFLTSLTYEPHYVYANHYVGVALLKMNRGGEALDYFNRALKIDAGFKPSLAMTKAMMGKK
ncbi:MAG: tetratricopeptide repeat protein [Deltaproteobacteria bacterium]|nr:tetratricopeptide repeat protein [Deltaproteobacteria bacterium]